MQRSETQQNRWIMLPLMLGCAIAPPNLQENGEGIVEETGFLASEFSITHLGLLYNNVPTNKEHRYLF